MRALNDILSLRRWVHAPLDKHDGATAIAARLRTADDVSRASRLCDTAGRVTGDQGSPQTGQRCVHEEHPFGSGM